MDKKDYSYRGWLLLLAVIIATAALNFIPPTEVFGLNTKQVDLLSQLRAEPESEGAENSPAEYTPDFAALEQELAAAEVELPDSVQNLAPIRYEWIVAPDTLKESRELFSEHLQTMNIKAEHQVPIEDFDTTGSSPLNRFIGKLIDGKGVRIAVLGDSFIEGDIITVDLRERLQELFGGRGVGFVPCAIPFDLYRTSVRRQVSGWDAYSLLNKGNTPSSYRDKFFMSGYLAAGHRGSTARWQVADVKPHLDSCSRARILVTCRDTCNIELTLNDTLKHNVGISGADYVRELYVEAPINSIKMRVLSGNVLCHGSSIEGGQGVTVDNFSIRGNSGFAIFGSSVAANLQIDNMLGYDLVVLQYGLNAIQPGQRTFGNYQKRLCDMITYCQRSFPNAAILVLGVSDRAVKRDGNWSSIKSVEYMGPYQRKAAQICGVSFWELGKVVMSYGGINGFVKNGWAAGDHIHINFKGGARIAASLAQAIQQRAYDMLVKRESKDLTKPLQIVPKELINFDLTEDDFCMPDILLLGQPKAQSEPAKEVESTKPNEAGEQNTESAEKGDSEEPKNEPKEGEKGKENSESSKEPIEQKESKEAEAKPEKRDAAVVPATEGSKEQVELHSDSKSEVVAEQEKQAEQKVEKEQKESNIETKQE